MNSISPGGNRPSHVVGFFKVSWGHNMTMTTYIFNTVYFTRLIVKEKSGNSGCVNVTPTHHPTQPPTHPQPPTPPPNPPHPPPPQLPYSTTRPPPPPTTHTHTRPPTHPPTHTPHLQPRQTDPYNICTLYTYMYRTYWVWQRHFPLFLHIQNILCTYMQLHTCIMYTIRIK